jgi:hypothetical protein
MTDPTPPADPPTDLQPRIRAAVSAATNGQLHGDALDLVVENVIAAIGPRVSPGWPAKRDELVRVAAQAVRDHGAATNVATIVDVTVDTLARAYWAHVFSHPCAHLGGGPLDESGQCVVHRLRPAPVHLTNPEGRP